MPKASKEFKPLSTNSLMAHLRNECGIAIGGSAEKKKLQNIGYYHGYKGYRFAKSERSRLPISDFSELYRLYLLDNRLKAAFYPWIMRTETALKNCILESICAEAARQSITATYDDICKHCFDANAKDRYGQLSFLSSKIAKSCGQDGRAVVRHFTEASRGVPIWALLEVLTLGEFGKIYGCLSHRIKDDVYKKLGMPQRVWDTSLPGVPKRDKKDLLLALLNAMTSLRNSVAHDNVIADARFAVKNKPGAETCAFFNQAFGLGSNDVSFSDLPDYMLLVCFFMVSLGFTKTDCKAFVRSYEQALEEFAGDALCTKMIGKSSALPIKAAYRFISNH